MNPTSRLSLLSSQHTSDFKCPLHCIQLSKHTLLVSDVSKNSPTINRPTFTKDTALLLSNPMEWVESS